MGEGNPSLREGPGQLSKMQACQPTNQNSEEEFPLLEKGAFSESEVTGTPYLSCRSGDLEVENWQGWRLGLLSSRLMGSPVAGFLQPEPACSTPAPVWGGLLKGQR